MQIYQSVERSLIIWDLKVRRKTTLTKERFGKKALFKTVLDFLLEPKNVRISYVCETHEVEFIMLKSMFT